LILKKYKIDNENNNINQKIISKIIDNKLITIKNNKKKDF
jgi:hypothetical protein